MTARPALRLVEPWEGPPRRGLRAHLSWRLFRLRELAEAARWHVLSAVLAAVATAGMRRRAWAEGFAVALGQGPVRSRLDHLDEWQAGNELASELAYQAHGRLTLGPCRPFLVPEIHEDLTDLSQPAPAWPPLVAPRLIVASAGRHVAPEIRTRVRISGRRSAAPRHGRPSPVRLAARWLRDWVPLRDMLPGGPGRSGPLRAAA